MMQTKPPAPPEKQFGARRIGNGNSLSANEFAGAGIQFALALVIFVFLGAWLDRRLGTSPIFILAGVLLGGGGAFFSFYRKIAAAQRRDDENRRKAKGESGR
jgi:F0F1-type ATP synthase assembly protein I